MATNNRKPAARPATRNAVQNLQRRGPSLSLPMLTVIGLGAGAAAMYFFDPEAGKRRRQVWMESAGTAMDSGRGLAGRAWDGISTHAHDAAARLAEATSHLPDREVAMQAASGLRSSLTSRASDLYDAARARFARHEHHSNVPLVAGFFGSAVGCLVTGAALMFVFDPHRGRVRRAFARDQVVRFVTTKGRNFREAGKDWADRFRGRVSDAVHTVKGKVDKYRTDWSEHDDETSDDESDTIDSAPSKPEPNLM